MNKYTTALLLLLISVSLFAQEYPEITIKDVQFMEDDSLLAYGAMNQEPYPALATSGDTVIQT